MKYGGHMLMVRKLFQINKMSLLALAYLCKTATGCQYSKSYDTDGFVNPSKNYHFYFHMPLAKRFFM